MTYPAHFSLEEFLHSDTGNSIGASNYPSWEVVDNLRRVADIMENIRSGAGVPVIISSGYRSPPVNAAVGGAENSAHLYGLACDFTIPDWGSPLDICLKLEPYVAYLGIDQLINEVSWVHLGLAANGAIARGECMTINENGTCYGF